MTTDQEVVGSNPTGCTLISMKVNTLIFRHKINRSLEEVFDFFESPENLSKITPTKLKFQILTPLPIKMQEGQLIDYSIKLFGKRVHWRTMITSYNKNVSFIDQQLKGPYVMWHHFHEFSEVDGKVEMIDTVNYIVPFGILGRIVNYLYLKRELMYIFDYRKKVINNIFK